MAPAVTPTLKFTAVVSSSHTHRLPHRPWPAFQWKSCLTLHLPPWCMPNLCTTDPMAKVATSTSLTTRADWHTILAFGALHRISNAVYADRNGIRALTSSGEGTRPVLLATKRQCVRTVRRCHAGSSLHQEGYSATTCSARHSSNSRRRLKMTRRKFTVIREVWTAGWVCPNIRAIASTCDCRLIKQNNKQESKIDIIYIIWKLYYKNIIINTCT